MATVADLKNHLVSGSPKMADASPSEGGRGAGARLSYTSRWWSALLCALPGLAEPPLVWAVRLIEAMCAVRDDGQSEEAPSCILASAWAVATGLLELCLCGGLGRVLPALPRRLREAVFGDALSAQETCEPAPAPDFTLIAAACQPAFFDIAAFACGSPQELGVLARTAKTVAAELEPANGALWSSMYKSRWPAFHDFLDHQGPQQWDGLYQDTLAGKTEVLLEVFDREKKPGFAMAAMPALITFDAGRGSYVASYISARAIPPEHIPEWEAHRLRCCPPDVRDALRVRPLPGSDSGGPYMDRVLPGFEGLRPGVGVELQWRMQEGSPFGWWYVHLDALDHDEGGALATATVTFRHFPSNSRFYRLQVRFGDSQMRPCKFGGFTGGIRSTTEAERSHWMDFFPRRKVVR